MSVFTVDFEGSAIQNNLTQPNNNNNNNNNNNIIDFFSGLFENRPIKVFGMVISIISSVFYVLLYYHIIWYEKFGSDKKRTILNKLVSSICAAGILWHGIVQPIEMSRYIFGPLPAWMCNFHFTLKNVIGIQFLLFYDSISLLRYLFIFWLKNPTGFCDDFWTKFVNVWIIVFSFISQILHSILPGLSVTNISSDLAILWTTF